MAKAKTKTVRVKFTQDHETNSNPEDKMRFTKGQVCHFTPERARFFVNRGVAEALDDINAPDAEVPAEERGDASSPDDPRKPTNLKGDTVGPAPDTEGRAEPNESGGVKANQPGAEGGAKAGEGTPPDGGEAPAAPGQNAAAPEPGVGAGGRAGGARAGQRPGSR